MLITDLVKLNNATTMNTARWQSSHDLAREILREAGILGVELNFHDYTIPYLQRQNGTPLQWLCEIVQFAPPAPPT